MSALKEIIINTLVDALLPLGLQNLLTDAALDKLTRLFYMLETANKTTNITAIDDPRGVALRHFADSITLSPLLPQGAKVIDVGCGGGFPCLPLAIVRQDLSFVALDSISKKLKFVDDAARELSLDVITLNSRAEEASRTEKHREMYDAAISRAVAKLNILAELCLPFVKIGGIFTAMKGQNADMELNEAKNAISATGACVENLSRFTLLEAGERVLVSARKISPTPKELPRPFARIKKKPL